MIDPSHWFQFKPVEIHGTYSAEYTCPPNLPYLEGHFPNAPIMPAVAIIDASQEFLRTIATSYNLKKIESAKFSSAIHPKMSIQLEAQEISPNYWRVSWKRGDHVLAELRLIGS